MSEPTRPGERDADIPDEEWFAVLAGKRLPREGSRSEARAAALRATYQQIEGEAPMASDEAGTGGGSPRAGRSPEIAVAAASSPRRRWLVAPVTHFAAALAGALVVALPMVREFSASEFASVADSDATVTDIGRHMSADLPDAGDAELPAEGTGPDGTLGAAADRGPASVPGGAWKGSGGEGLEETWGVDSLNLRGKPASEGRTWVASSRQPLADAQQLQRLLMEASVGFEAFSDALSTDSRPARVAVVFIAPESLSVQLQEFLASRAISVQAGRWTRIEFAWPGARDTGSPTAEEPTK